MKTTAVFLIILGIGCSGAAAWAADAGSESVRREMATQTDLLDDVRKTLQPLSDEPVIESEDQPDRPRESGPIFLVKKITITGNTLFRQAELDAWTAPMEGREMSFGDIEAFADALTARYVAKGYTTSAAFIPPQTVVDGLVEIEIMEGRVGSVSVEGNRWFGADVYRKSVPLEEGDLFRMEALEDAIRQMNAEPDRAVRAYLQPGQAKGTTDVVLKARDEQPMHASYEYSLRGTKFTHRPRHVTHLTHNNLTGNGDSFKARLTMAEQNAVFGGVFSYELPIRSTGTLLYVTGALAESRMQRELRELEVRGDSKSIIVGALQEIHADARSRLDWMVQGEAKNSKTAIAGETLFSDRMRVVTTGPRAEWLDAGGKTMLATDVHVGIPDFLGASPDVDPSASRVDSGGEFVYYTGNFARVQRLDHDMIFVFQSTGQYSPEPLTSIEQFNLGGMYSVRGYPENDASGDSGFGLSGELRIPPYFIPKDARVPGVKGKTWYEAVSLVAFADGGRTFNLKRQLPTSDKDRTMIGAGAGVRFYVSPDFNVQCDLGFPLGDQSSDKDRPQIHLLARFGF